MTSLALNETRKGMALAVRNCGRWPTAATLAEYVTAAQRAEDEINRAIETWQRWVRRFDPAPDRRELGSTRTNVRHQIALGRFEQISEAISMLLGPPLGSA